MNTKRGSSAVFLCVIMSGIAAVCIGLSCCAREYSVSSRMDALANLTLDSVLSEYDLKLQQEYNLFLLRDSDETLTKRADGYLRPSLRDMKDVQVSRLSVKGTFPAAIDTAAVKDQILKWMKAGGMLAAHNGPAASGSGAGEAESADSSGAGEAESADSSGGTDPEKPDGRILRHGPTIASLPSRRLPKQNLADRAKAAGRQLLNTSHPVSEGTDRFLLESYLLGTFNSCADQKHSSHFFRYETEYVLHGGLSDAENRQAAVRSIEALRFIPNLTFLYTDPEKHGELAACTELLFPGVTGAAIEFAAAAAWAWAESSNDAKLLLAGRRVPAVKTPDTWALSFENIPSGAGSDMILPAVSRGLSYSDHLRLLLYLEDETVLLSRVLDLIQINMRKDYDSAFLISACCAGISLSMTVNGRDFYYEKTY